MFNDSHPHFPPFCVMQKGSNGNYIHHVMFQKEEWQEKLAIVSSGGTGIKRHD